MPPACAIPTGLPGCPRPGKLWAVVNERDELGSDLVPDYMTALVDGGFYGFPFSYYGSHMDARVKEQQPDLVAKALVPDYALGAHTASLGLVYDRAGGAMRPGRFPKACLSANMARGIASRAAAIASYSCRSRTASPRETRRCVDRFRQ